MTPDMASEMSASPSLDAAHQLLKQFDCLHQATIAPDQQQSLRQAVLQVAEHSDYQILGICAESFAAGRTALFSYARVLGYEPELASEPIEGAVYIKFNPRSGLCYVDSYTGEYRGVLVSCQSDFADGVNDMYGHLPLDLFDSIPGT
jgi:hypothetical protein